MKKMTVFVLVLLEASILFCCGSSTEKKLPIQESQSASASSTQVNELPKMVITLLDGSRLECNKLGGNIAIIVFFPECDHCQREAVEIQKEIESFKDYTLYFVTTENKPLTEKFAIEYKLNNYENVKFGFITVNDVVTNFGSIPTPSLYLYSSDHKRIQSFEGETDIQAILKYVK
ncbi:MAG TPA: redoxin domain-containing protein [Chryseolinea sp.]|nr:redoxin domain-containing protein [Chryseolinea sp.]HPH45794.1 redoxin domain-containing protein [Chryseolinea sp.]HPM28864.1 redoxin domain-containing protein [Chryseolinea sp.]